MKRKWRRCKRHYSRSLSLRILSFLFFVTREKEASVTSYGTCYGSKQYIHALRLYLWPLLPRGWDHRPKKEPLSIPSFCNVICFFCPDHRRDLSSLWLFCFVLLQGIKSITRTVWMNLPLSGIQVLHKNSLQSGKRRPVLNSIPRARLSSHPFYCILFIIQLKRLEQTFIQIILMYCSWFIERFFPCLW